MKTIALGVDVGGTTTSVGAVTAEGDVVAHASAPTHAGDRGTAIETIVELLDLVTRRSEVRGATLAGVGVGVPAIVDAAKGIVGDEAHHVPDLAGYALGPTLAARLGVPAFIDNDVNALALGEWKFGAGRGARSLVVLAPGTGFGAGIVLDGRLVRGAHGFGGELGHTPVKFDGERCWCGGRGCLALYASGRGIAEGARGRIAAGRSSRLVDDANGDPAAITAPLVFRAAEHGDAVARDVVDLACRALGAMIATVVNGLNPEVVVITGGVAESFASVERRVLAAAADHAYARAIAATRVRIEPADKGTTMRGAAALVWEEHGAPRDRRPRRRSRSTRTARATRRQR